MYRIDNFLDNDEVEVIKTLDHFQVIQYARDLSCRPEEAATKYYMSMMNVTKKQVVCNMKGNSIILQKGAMQWMVGDIEQTSGIKGAGDLFGKVLASKVTGESAVKPVYKGNGMIVTEPSYMHYLLESVEMWGEMVISDGMFLACDGTVGMKVVARDNISSALGGGEGLFNLCLTGRGVVVLGSRVPREELIMVDLKNDQIKIDGPYAIAWSNSLKFTVERSGKSLIGSAASGEGLVNVYRGTGKILMMPQV